MNEVKISSALSMYQAVQLNLSGSKIQTAISFYGRRLSFDEVFSLIDVLADNLAARYSIGKGDTVTLCMPNSPSALLCFYAANKLGAAVNLVHPYLPPEKLKESAEKTRSKLLVVYDAYPHSQDQKPDFSVPILESDCAYFMGAAAKIYYRVTNKKLGWGDKLEKLLKKSGAPQTVAANFEENQAAVYLASGGTTGEPKIIVHNNYTFNLLCGKAREFLSEELENYTSLYNVLPIFHGFGLCINMHMCMLMRRTNIMCIKFNAKMCSKQIRRERASILTGVPTMYLKLLNEKSFVNGDLSSIKDVYVGGDSAPQALIEEFNAVLARGGSSARMYEGYGLTGTVTVGVVNTKRHNRVGSIGYPLSDTFIKIIKEGKVLPAGEVGEIYLKTPLFMRGYLEEDAQPFAEQDGETWLKTGDYGYLDEDGFLYFKQRIKNMIKVSGVPVFPSEIEGVAALAENVNKVCAVGMNDAVKGQVVKLYVEPKIGADAERLRAEIAALCRAKLISYAVPKSIEIRERLPVNLIGKIDRKVLEAENSKNA